MNPITERCSSQYPQAYQINQEPSFISKVALPIIFGVIGFLFGGFAGGTVGLIIGCLLKSSRKTPVHLTSSAQSSSDRIIRIPLTPHVQRGNTMRHAGWAVSRFEDSPTTQAHREEGQSNIRRLPRRYSHPTSGSIIHQPRTPPSQPHHAASIPPNQSPSPMRQNRQPPNPSFPLQHHRGGGAIDQQIPQNPTRPTREPNPELEKRHRRDH